MLNAQAKKILEVAQDVTDDPDVQAGYPDANGNTKVTWCNRALNRMLTRLNGDASLLLEPRGINWTNANTMIQNARKKCERVANGNAAQCHANSGDLVIAMIYNNSGSGHVALVVPDLDDYDDRYGPEIGQAGTLCGIMSARKGFSNFFDSIEYFQVPYLGSGVGG